MAEAMTRDTAYKLAGDVEPVTAQVVVDAIRFALGAQSNPQRRDQIVTTLLELAPETCDDKGLELIRELVVNGRLAVQVVS
jgi:hypothetical protein